MIFDSDLEVKLYKKESVELPDFIKDKFPKIKFVYQPENIDDIQWIFSYSRKNKLSIIPRGAATSGLGGIIPLRKSIIVDLAHLNKILDLDKKNKTIYFEAGLRWWELKLFLKRYSFDLYTYPTSLFSTVGGWLSTGGYGINSFKYGHVSNLVESIEVITPDNSMVIDRKDPKFKYFIGTEGQMGIITRVKLKIRETTLAKPYLVFFETTSQAVEFLSDVFKSAKIAPSHVSYLDRYRLEHKNLFLNGKVSFPQLEGVLVVFEDNSQDETFLNLVKNKEGILTEDYLTTFLWNERYFPLSIKHFYPAILGCETILPVENLSQYLTNIREFAENFGITLSTEATFINKKEAVVFTIFPSNSKKIIHSFHLLLTYSLNRIALSSGGKPYGIGIWNLPLLNKKFSEEEIREYRSFKKEVDPMNLINYGKSFSSGNKITYLLRLAYLLSIPFSTNNSITKYLSKDHNHNSEKIKKSNSETDACANCGACSIICPAYLKDRNEIVTAKGKLFLLKHLLNGDSIPKQIAENVFLCLHCKLCENVCQSKLKLSPLWDKLESIVENKFGRPKEKIDEFVKQIESNQEYTRLLDLLNIPDNNRKEMQNV